MSTKEVRAAFPSKEMRRILARIIREHIPEPTQRGPAYRLAAALRAGHRFNRQYTADVAAYEAVEACSEE